MGLMILHFTQAVWYRRSHDVTDIDSTYIRRDKLDMYHGVPSGMYQADEHLAGTVRRSYIVEGEIVVSPGFHVRTHLVCTYLCVCICV